MANPGLVASFDPNDMTSWYFRELSRAEATRLLLNETESGIFLVRDSRTISGDFVLCVRSYCCYGLLVGYIILYYVMHLGSWTLTSTVHSTTTLDREDDRVSHYIINRVISADGTVRYRIGDQLFADMPALLAFYRLHYLDTTPLTRPLQSQVLELVVARFDFAGNDSDDLPFQRGERLMVIKRDEDQWWTAKNSQGRTGSIPVPYVQRIVDPSGAPYPPSEALAQLSAADSPATLSLSPPNNIKQQPPQRANNMQRRLPALARVKQTRVPNAYDKTALRLEEGDIITVTKININGQWEGELNGRVGHFPFTYVEFLDENPAS